MVTLIKQLLGTAYCYCSFMLNHAALKFKIYSKKNKVGRKSSVTKSIQIDRATVFLYQFSSIIMDPLNCIELTLKTPNQRFDDIRLKCNEDWTIKKLKEHLQDVYPSKPVS